MKRIKIILVLMFSTIASFAMAGEIKSYSQTQFNTLTAQHKPVLLVVYASWCPTCQAQKPIIDKLMGEPTYKGVTALVIDFDKEKALLRQYKVNMQSTLIAFKGAKEVGRLVGDTSESGIEGLVKKTIQ